MVVVLVITTKQSWTPGGINGGWRQLSNNYLTTTTSGSPGRHHLPLLHVHCLPLLSHPAIIRPLLSSKFQRSSPLLLLQTLHHLRLQGLNTTKPLRRWRRLSDLSIRHHRCLLGLLGGGIVGPERCFRSWALALSSLCPAEGNEERPCLLRSCVAPAAVAGRRRRAEGLVLEDIER